MNKAASGLLAAVATFAVAGTAQAQLVPNLTPFSVEVRGGAAFPRDAEGVKTGYTIGADLGVNVMPAVSLYAGYSRSTFGEDGGDGDATLSGFDVGARVEIPTPLIPIDPWIKAGAVFHKLDIDGEEASDRETGYELGAGVGFGLIPKVTLSPSVTYTKIGGDLDASHVRAEVALRVRI
jgi:opacity protein-like surface antigen